MRFVHNGIVYRSNDYYIENDILYIHLGQYSRSIPPEKYYDIFQLNEIKIIENTSEIYEAVMKTKTEQKEVISEKEFFDLLNKSEDAKC